MDWHAPVVLIELTAGDTDTGKRARVDFTLPRARQFNALVTSTLANASRKVSRRKRSESRSTKSVLAY